MFRLMERRGIYFLISIVIMLPGIIYMVWSLTTRGQLLPLSIDYTGGTLWELRFDQAIDPTAVRQVFVSAGYPDTAVYTVTDERTVEIKLKNLESSEKQALVANLTSSFGAFEEFSYRSLGPTIGSEVSRAAILAIALASVLILLYIAWAFRQVSHPVRFGVCAVIALIHDVLVIISFMCVMNWLAGWEMDALFLTAALTVIGYSVSDTIVVFDRIRENFKRYRGESFTTITNRSIIETANRSLATHVTTALMLIAILVLGGPTLRQFIATLFVGILSGTFSSIFNASALLVAWDERSWLHHDRPAHTPVDGQAALA
jgi:preprotein translocase subunit SecF